MTEYTSIRVTVDAKEDAEESKRDGETWNEYLQRCTENPPEAREYVDADALDSVDARIVDMDAAERRQFAEEVAGVLRE